MSQLLKLLDKPKFHPQRFTGLVCWFDPADISSITFSYNALVETVSGTISTNTLTASADVSSKLEAGNLIKANGAEVYTVASVSTVTITTVEALSATYSGGTSVALAQVSQINDMSGRGNHATQGTATAQPTYRINQTTGKGELDFDGSADFMSIADHPSISLTGDCTFFMVGNLTNTTNSPTYIAKDANASYRLRIETAGQMWLLLDDGGGLATYASTSTVTTGSTVVLTTIVDIGTDVNFRQNGVDFGTVAVGKASIADTAGALLIGSIDGASEFYRGTMNEMAIYDRKFSPTETSTAETYFANKSGVLM